MANQVSTWRCSVCGYIHEGDAPPENCPVCGVPAGEFEEISKQTESVEPKESASKGKAWRCQVCGYIHYGDEPPDECPVCGASASDFEAVDQEAPEAVEVSAASRIVIAGAGIAGLSAAKAAREAAPDAVITLLSAEAEAPYYRLNLTRYLAGEIADEDLPIHSLKWYEENRIDLVLGTALEKVHPSERKIELRDGSEIKYDKLIVATGAHPFVPPISGSGQPHVYTLRTAGDAKKILSAVSSETQVVCIGGGILGLETAGALARQGASVTVLEAFDHLMPLQLNTAGSDVMVEHLYTLGIDVMTQAQTEKIEAKTVQLKDGTMLPADVVVITVGVRANDQMLKDAGLPVHRGVLVDNYMRTSNADILAAGDVCEHDGVIYGSWTAAQYQGKIAGMNAAGKPTEFGGIPRSHMLKVLGKNMFSIGEIRSGDGSYTCIDDHPDGNYRMFMLQDGVLIGALLLGDLKLMSACRSAIESKKRIAEAASIEELIESITPD
jgi:nitrite reductase (NADH) large subunit